MTETQDAVGAIGTAMALGLLAAGIRVAGVSIASVSR
jgi:hypothetical protein